MNRGSWVQTALTCVDGDGQALHRGHGEGTEQGADADVDQDVGPTEARTDVEHEHDAQNQHSRGVHQET